MRAKSTRIILLTDFPGVENPGGIILPGASSIVRNARSERTIIWNMRTEEFPEGENICDSNITHTTYAGSGEWCGYFGNIFNEHGYNNRYLNLTLSGTVNTLITLEYIFYLYGNAPTSYWTYPNNFLGSAAIDPSDNCSQAHNLRLEMHSNGNPIVTSIVDQRFIGIDMVNTEPLDPFIINRTTQYGHPTGLFPADGINTPFGADSRITPSQISIINDHEKQFIAPGGWFWLGWSPGVFNAIGTVSVTLSNEHTLYDQLILDGAAVTPTRGSRIVSLDNESGAYEATVSAVTFTIPDSLNVNGVEYVVMFRVRRTPDGGEPVLMEIWHYYTGNGNSGETMTVQLPPAINSITEFVGECVSLIPASALGDYDNFERLDADSWAFDVAGWKGWQEPMRFLCGGTISYDSFERITSDPDEALILSSELDSGHCWDGNLRFIAQNDFTWDDMEGKVDGEEVVIWSGGVGWLGLGKFFQVDFERTIDDFDSYADGTATDWPDGVNWGGVGTFIEDAQPIAEDDFDSYADGAITALDVGNGWDGDGHFIT